MITLRRITACLVVFLGLALGPTAHAEMDQALCKNHANFVYTIAKQGCDGGISEKETTDKVTEVAAKRGLSENDVNQMLLIIKVVYTHPEKSAFSLADEFYTLCMKQVEANN